MKTRSRCTPAKVVRNVNTKENMDMRSDSNHLQTGKKRTLNEISTSTPTPAQSTSDPRVSKRARITSAAHTRPIQLDLGEGDGGDQRGLREASNEASNHKAVRRPPPLKRSAAEVFADTVLSRFPALAYDINDGDTEVESEEEYLTEPGPAEPAGRTSSRALDVMLVERPVWGHSSSSPATGSANTNLGNVIQDDNVPSSQETISGGEPPILPPAAPVSMQPSWPAETDLLLVPGSNKVMLTAQRPLIRAVFQDAFERIRAALLFRNAFPDLYEAIEMVKDGLVAAAESNDRATDIHSRLLGDASYANNMYRLPRARIPLFRGEVKDRCAAIIQSEFLALGSSTLVTELVDKQLSNYNYTFPRSTSGNPTNYLPMRTRPYRNIRIINVIRDLYFVGGNHSFAQRFREEFPVHQGSDGMVMREVPISMVALVATALYVAIQEWRSGTQKSLEFSANSFLDVYSGHVNTFKHIRENREQAFHLLMRDIYSQASAGVTGMSSTPIAELELEDMEE